MSDLNLMTATESAFFRKNGYLLLRSVFPEAEVASLLAEVTRMSSQAHAMGAVLPEEHYVSNENSYRLFRIMRFSQAFDPLIDHPGYFGKMVSLIGFHVQLMGADGLFSPDFLAAAGSAALGMYLSSPDFSTFGSAYSEQFLPAYEAKFGSKAISAFHAGSTGLIVAAWSWTGRGWTRSCAPSPSGCRGTGCWWAAPWSPSGWTPGARPRC